MSSLKLYGSTSGYVEIVPEATAGNNSVTLPSGSGTLVTQDGSGNITITGRASVPLGSASSPSIYFDDNTGIYSPGADQLAITTGGTARITIDASGNINIDSGGFYYDAANNRLGLGTSTPGYRLSVDSGVSGFIASFKGGSRTGYIYGDNDAIYIATDTILSTGIGINETDDKFTVYTGNAPRVTVNSSGSVGIGSNAPDSLFQVAGAANIRIAYNGTSVNYLDADSNIFRSGNGVERGRWDSNGRFLVGTSSLTANVSAAFKGNSFSSNTNASIYLMSDFTNPVAGQGVGTIKYADGNENVLASIDGISDGTWGSGDYPGRLVFSTTADGASSPTTRMTIDSSGNLLLRGLTSTWVSNYAGAIYNRGDSPSLVIGRTDATGAASEVSCIFTNGGNSAVGTISVSNTATAYNTSSDYRLKENVVPLTGATDRLNQLQVHRFNFIADPDTTVDGFLAHEAQSVVPECVTGTKDEVDADGNPVYQGIDQSKLVPLLTAALQEALHKIETQAGVITALDARLKVLESQ